MMVKMVSVNMRSGSTGCIELCIWTKSLLYRWDLEKEKKDLGGISSLSFRVL